MHEHHRFLVPSPGQCPCTRHGTLSLGHRVNGSFGWSFTSGSPGHLFHPVWDPSFPGFRKKPKIMIQRYIFLWKFVQPPKKYLRIINDLQNFTFQKRANAKQRWKLANLLPIANVCLQHKSTFGVHHRTGLPGQLGLRVAGFPGHWVAGSQNVTQFHVWLLLLSLVCLRSDIARRLRLEKKYLRATTGSAKRHQRHATYAMLRAVTNTSRRPLETWKSTTERSSRQLLIRQLAYYLRIQVYLMNSRSTTATHRDMRQTRVPSVASFLACVCRRRPTSVAASAVFSAASVSLSLSVHVWTKHLTVESYMVIYAPNSYTY